MKCLIDGDILLYEVGFANQFVEDGEIIPKPFDDVSEYLHQKIEQIEEECWATEPSTLYLTGKGNFREEIAKTKVYKGNRKAAKPFHYYNIKAYMEAMFDTKHEDGLEADDLMSIEATKNPEDTIICSRDKDLLMVEGNHFSWMCGKQQPFGPIWVDHLGELSLNDKRKIKGNGLMFFYSQLITGDTTDNIGGLPKGGDVLAYRTLDGCRTEQEMYKAVSDLYKERVGEDWEEYFIEQANLLWMVRELDSQGKPIFWRKPNG